MLILLDFLLLSFHLALVAFNLLGWIWPRLRRLHLITLTATLLSWFGLGALYGWGYCPSTDWHWQIKRARGVEELPSSFITYYLDRLTGISWDPGLVDAVVVIVTVAVWTLSLYLNVRQARRRSS